MKKNRIWTNDELEFVKKNANTMSCYDIGLKIGRSYVAVLHKLKGLEIKKKFVCSCSKGKKSKGYNDYKYIGKTYGNWVVIKRINTSQKRPYYLCKNFYGDERIFKQEQLKEIILNNEKPFIPQEKIKETKYPNIYVAENGNTYRKITLFNGKYSFIRYTTVSKQGYPRITVKVNGKRKNVSIHRLVAETFIPNPNNYPIINHKDENKQNNNVDNLEWCTYKYNNDYGTRKNKVRKTKNENRMRKQRQMVAN